MPDMKKPEEQAEALVPTPYLREQARVFALEGVKLWEETLRLTINDKPKWCPLIVYAAAVRLIIKQESDRKVFHENWTRRRRFTLFRPPKGGSLPPSKDALGIRVNP